MNDLILIHGFGMPMAIFDRLIKSFEPHFNCINIALPGDIEPFDLPDTKQSVLEKYVDFIVPQIKRPAIFLGWSLGGILALAIAKKHPQLTKKLILVSSTIKFTQTTRWQPAIKSADLLLFFKQIQQNYLKAIKQFLTLQTLYATNQKTLIKELNQKITNAPDKKSIKAQLNILSTFDFREIVQKITVSTFWIVGDMDKITPFEASLKACEMMPNADCLVLKKCGHLPFYTHFDIFFNAIIKWTTLD